MVDIVTYSSENAKPDNRWVGYIVMPNGEYLGIMFRAATEEAVKAKAEKFWADNYKPRSININDLVDADEAEVKAIAKDDPWSGLSDGRGKHFAGKVWMRHAEHGLKRVEADQVGQLMEAGWYKSGPRGK